MFEVGDKVICVDVDDDDIGWEVAHRDFTDQRPEEGVVYEVGDTTYDRADKDLYSIALWIDGGDWYYHPDHFRHAKMTNTQKIKKRKEQFHGT